MDAVFVDVSGNKKNFLYQYDKNQFIEIENFEYSIAPKVHFQIKSIEQALSVGSRIIDGTLKIAIPNTLLTYGEDIVAYLYIEDAEQGYVVETIFISVIQRKKPANYNYTSEMFARTVDGTTMSDNFGYADVLMVKPDKDEDGNLKYENLNGYFISVIFDDEYKRCVRKATSLNDVYGVSVDNPGFVSNCNDYKLDAFGNPLPEYTYVCSFGFASVIDDGTCSIGGMCVPNSDGIATSTTSTVGYNVIDRIDDTHVFIFVNPSMGTFNGLQSEVYEINSNLNSHINNVTNPHNVTKAQVGLGNADDTSDADKPISIATQNALDTINDTLLVKADLVDGLIPLSQLPSHADTHKSDGSDPLLYSDIGAAAEVHTHTKDEVGLENVDNTSDADKPISTATQEALDTKATLIDGKLSKDVLPDNIGISNIVVDTIADRDALTPTKGMLVHVKDASNDETVSSAYADYIYDGEVWVKTGGYVSSGSGEGSVTAIEWANITNKPSSFTPSTHASTHAIDGSDPITPSDIGAATQIDLVALQERVDNLAVSAEFVMTDSTTGGQYTLGVNNGKLMVIPVGEIVEPYGDGDTIAY